MRSFVKWGSALALVAILAVSFWAVVRGFRLSSWPPTELVRFTEPLRGVRVGRSNTSQQEKADGAGTVQEIRKVAESVPGVKVVWPVQSGNDVIIGIDMDLPAEGRQKDVELAVEREVRSRVRTVDEVFVTADPSQTLRLRQISQSLILGRPISDFTVDLAELQGSISNQGALPGGGHD